MPTWRNVQLMCKLLHYFLSIIRMRSSSNDQRRSCATQLDPAQQQDHRPTVILKGAKHVFSTHQNFLKFNLKRSIVMHRHMLNRPVLTVFWVVSLRFVFLLTWETRILGSCLKIPCSKLPKCHVCFHKLGMSGPRPSQGSGLQLPIRTQAGSVPVWFASHSWNGGFCPKSDPLKRTQNSICPSDPPHKWP